MRFVSTVQLARLTIVYMGVSTDYSEVLTIVIRVSTKNSDLG